MWSALLGVAQITSRKSTFDEMLQRGVRSDAVDDEGYPNTRPGRLDRSPQKVRKMVIPYMGLQAARAGVNFILALLGRAGRI